VASFVPIGAVAARVFENSGGRHERPSIPRQGR
jgi:hypothetical protein